MDNYGVETEDIYIPLLPELDDEPSYTTLESYNPLLTNKATTVKDQGKHGACSMFATNALLETTGLYKTGLKYDLSEQAMRYILSEKLMYANNSGEEGFYTNSASKGGNFDKTSTYITNINNPIIENNTINWISPNLSKYVPYTGKPDENDPEWLNNIDTSYCSYYAQGTKYINEEEIKNYILENGCVFVTFYADQEHGLNKDTNSFYTNQHPDEINHAIAVVGWDDNFSVNNFLETNRPNHNGAWLVKNSWGSNENSNGYFWISYEDTSFNCKNDAAVISNIGKRSKNEYMLSYDFMPMTAISPYSVGNDNCIYMTNVYDVSDLTNDYGSINKVTFYSRDIGSFYKIYLTPLSGSANTPNISNLGSSLYSGVISAEGYITSNFSQPYILNEGTNKIAVTIKLITDKSEKQVFQLTREGYNLDYCPSINYGESYYYSNGIWTDVKSDASIVGNFCIRPTLVRRTPITQNSTLSSNGLIYSGSDVTVNLNLNGNLLYRITENGNTILFEDNQFVRTENSVTFKSSYLSSLGENQYKNIVFEFTDGENQTLKIAHEKYLPDVSISGKVAVGQTISADLGGFSDSEKTFQWQSSSDGTSWSNISNATNSTYTITSGDFLKYLRVNVNTMGSPNSGYPQGKFSPASDNKVVLYGDANLDGTIDIKDKTTIQRYLAGIRELTVEQFVAADVDGDGIVDIKDVNLISHYCAGNIQSFPVETN